MAHGLKNAGILVHQALHGYADGHRLLACSTVLKARDQKTMLIMSDASGPNAIIGDAGYVTGYPLTESGVYALACTWAATEMPRPGCVWTHTLLLDFADLAVLPTMEFLMTAFRRPTVEAAPGSFDAAINVEERQVVARPTEFDQDSLRRIVWALYKHPTERIIASSEDASMDLVFALWAQQWPRLRRAFRFCTLAFGDRSGEGSAFDLQLIPARERSVRARFSGFTDAERVRPSPAEWMEAALCDLSEGAEGKLRRFLREVGGDLPGGREAFVPLCRLYQLMPQFADREAAIDEAVGLLDSCFDSASADSLRLTFVAAIASHPQAISERGLSFVLNHLDLLDADSLQESAAAIGRSLWTQSPEALVNLLHEAAPRRSIAEHGLAKLSKEELLDGLRRSPTCIPAVLGERPELIEDLDLWTITGPWSEEGLTIAANHPERAEAALTAILRAKRNDLASGAVQIFGSAKILGTICNWTSGTGAKIDAEALSTWLAASVLDSEALAKVLSSECILDQALLVLIARKTFPDFVPNSYGEDPWWTSAHHAKGSLDDLARQYLSAYLLARALGYRSRNQAELIELTFDDVYFPAMHSTLSSEAWGVLEPRLPRTWFFDWDHCQRMRDALVDAFVDRDLSPVIFTRVTRDDNVFAQLTTAAARSGKGRRFLKRALQSLKNYDEPSIRAEILQDAI